MNKPIPNYTESLKERFHSEIEIQLIESEARLSPYDRELTMLLNNFGTLTNT